VIPKDVYYYLSLSLVPSSIIIIFSFFLRKMTSRFVVIFSLTKNLLQAITYIFNTMVFMIWNFVLLYLLNINFNIDIFSSNNTNFIVERILYVLLFSLFINSFMIGITVFKKGEIKNVRKERIRNN